LVVNQAVFVESGWKYAKTCPNVFKAFLQTFASVAPDTDLSVLFAR